MMIDSRTYLWSVILTLAGLAAVLVAAAPACAGEEPCLMCHEQLTKGASVHAAVQMGCATCHSALDAADMPHKVTNKNAHGLSSKMRDLCYSCHDKKPFMKNTVHGALALGCTSCHNPHSSPQARLLKDDIPKLCLNCHEEALVAGRGKSSHPLAKNTVCSNCHAPHATDTPKLFLSDQSPAGDKPALSMK